MKSGTSAVRVNPFEVHAHKILVADDDTLCAHRLTGWLQNQGYEVRTTSRLAEALEIIQTWQPQYIFANAFMPDASVHTLLRFIQAQKLSDQVKVVVMSDQPMPNGVSNIQWTGAAGYIVKPFAFENVFKILRPDRLNHTPSTISIRELNLIHMFLKQALAIASDEETLFNLTRLINGEVNGMRCSVVRCLNGDAGVVLASNDDRTVSGMPISLENYPEIREVMRTKVDLTIPDVLQSALLAPVRPHLERIGYQTLTLFPVFVKNEGLFGVLSLKLDRKSALELNYIEKFGQICAQILSLVVTPGWMRC